MESQHAEIHQKLGVFMLRVQRYERLLKALLIDSLVVGTVDTAPLHQQRRVELFAAKSMGYLVDELSQSYLREKGAEVADVDLPLDNGRAVFRTRLLLELEPEDLRQTRARLDAFRDLRNRLVHHLLDDHDLGTDDGRAGASALLERGLEAATAIYDEVLQWANASVEAQQQFAAFVQGPHFGALLDGIMPDGSIDWPNSTAVRLLRQQEEQTPTGEMTRLDRAIDAIRTSHPAQRPRYYRCRNWRQLLMRSGQFEIRHEQGTAEAPGCTWFRSWPEAP